MDAQLSRSDVTETWMAEGESAVLVDQFDLITRNDCKQRGGGVAVYKRRNSTAPRTRFQSELPHCVGFIGSVTSAISQPEKYTYLMAGALFSVLCTSISIKVWMLKYSNTVLRA